MDTSRDSEPRERSDQSTASGSSHLSEQVRYTKAVRWERVLRAFSLLCGFGYLALTMADIQVLSEGYSAGRYAQGRGWIVPVAAILVGLGWVVGSLFAALIASAIRDGEKKASRRHALLWWGLLAGVPALLLGLEALFRLSNVDVLEVVAATLHPKAVLAGFLLRLSMIGPWLLAIYRERYRITD